MTGGVGTGRWLAPEVIRGDSDYGPAVDIYSFGTLLTELDTNQIPYDNVRASNGKLMSDLTILHRVATGKLHPKLRSTCGKALRDLVERCLLEDPIKRPTAPAIAYELRVIQQDMADNSFSSESCQRVGYAAVAHSVGKPIETAAVSAHRDLQTLFHLQIGTATSFELWAFRWQVHIALNMVAVPSTGRVWPRHVASLGLAWILAVKVFSVVGSDCAAGPSILTTGGCTACDDYELCRGFSSASDCIGPNCKTDGNCTFECLNVDANAKTMVVLVEFGAYKSEEEIAAGGYNDSALANYPDETSEWPSVSNNQVSSLGTIGLPSQVSTLQSFQDMAHLWLYFVGNWGDQGGAAESRHGDPDKPTPRLSSVSLTTFHLSSGSGNSFSSRYFTSDQAAFLNNLDTLGLSDSDFKVTVGCGDSEKTTIHGVTVCIRDGVSTSSTSDSSDSSRSTQVDGLDSNGTSASKDSWTKVILGVLYGVSGVIIVCIIVTVSSRRKKKPDPHQTSDLDGYNGVRSPSSETGSRDMKKSHFGMKTLSLCGKEIASESSSASMGIPTSCEGDSSVDIPVLEASTISSTSVCPSFVSTAEKASDARPHSFIPIWNDYELLSLQLCAASIKDIRKIGSGGYATVWLVRYRNLQLLASKRLRAEKYTRKNITAFVEEIKLIANFVHPNIVKFIGAAWTTESDLQMLLEYMDGGDLQQYLSDARTPTGWTCHKFGFAIAVIEALLCLHSFVPPLLHRDLKSKNVLLSSDFKAKLSDFGKSRYRADHSTMTGGVGTSRWLAPEVIRGDVDYGCSADIYSFGVLLTELDTNKIPYSSTRGRNGKILSDMAIMHRVAAGRLYPKLRRTCGHALKDLVGRCLARNPSNRPTAAEVARDLREVQQEMATSLSKRAPWTTDFIGRGAKQPKRSSQASTRGLTDLHAHVLRRNATQLKMQSKHANDEVKLPRSHYSTNRDDML
ncbi:hypothetical protein ON010_g12540 [Phytophthora cinnamomi]|nr:hypothetical protein ON010_g12540 [Phytophthora cinnamomi]